MSSTGLAAAGVKRQGKTASTPKLSSESSGLRKNHGSGLSADTVELTDPVVSRPFPERDALLRFPTISGEIVVDPEAFIGDIINSVNDLTLDGFNNMEIFAEQTLNLESDDAQHALKLGVDSIYGKVQDNIDQNFAQWESVCRDRYFNFPAELQTISSSENLMNDGSKNSCVDDIQEQAVDTELNSLRSQLISAHREGAKMCREFSSLEKQLALRREILSDMTALEESFNGDVHEELLKSASLLQDTILKASRVRDNKILQQPRRHLLEHLAEPTLEEKTEFLQGSPHDMLVSGDANIVKLLGC